MRDRLDQLIHPLPADDADGGAGAPGDGDRGPDRTHAGRGAPLDASEDDPDAARVADLPGHAAGGGGDGGPALGPPSQDHRGS